MTNTPSTHYFTTTGPNIALKSLVDSSTQLKTALSHWVAKSFVLQEFPLAVIFGANLVAFNHRCGHDVREAVALAVAPISEIEKGLNHFPKRHMYEGDEILSPHFDWDALVSLLTPLQEDYETAGGLPSEFTLAMYYAATSLAYDFDIVRGMNGLGGGKTVSTFWN